MASCLLDKIAAKIEAKHFNAKTLELSCKELAEVSGTEISISHFQLDFKLKPLAALLASYISSAKTSHPSSHGLMPTRGSVGSIIL